MSPGLRSDSVEPTPASDGVALPYAAAGRLQRRLATVVVVVPLVGAVTALALAARFGVDRGNLVVAAALYLAWKSNKAAGARAGSMEIAGWISASLARRVGVAVSEIDPAGAFAEYGLDSRGAVALSGDLEDWLGRKLSPTLVWDYPTIDSLAEHLAAGQAAGASDGAH